MKMVDKERILLFAFYIICLATIISICISFYEEPVSAEDCYMTVIADKSDGTYSRILVQDKNGYRYLVTDPKAKMYIVNDIVYVHKIRYGTGSYSIKIN
jgi:hypothetical protein